MGETTGDHKTDIIVVGWNHTDETTKCIHSIERNTPLDKFHITYVDNGSAYPPSYSGDDLTVVYLPANTGYCHGNNVGLAISLLTDSEYVLLLNNDCEIPEGDTGWLNRMSRIMRAHKTVGVVGAVSDTVFGYQQRTKDKPRGEMLIVPALIGFCLLLRKTALEQVGLLDERFDPDGNYSDFDYSIRLARKGWKMAIAESVWINHVGSVTQKDLDFNANLRIGRARLNTKWGDDVLRGVGL